MEAASFTGIKTVSIHRLLRVLFPYMGQRNHLDLYASSRFLDNSLCLILFQHLAIGYHFTIYN